MPIFIYALLATVFVSLVSLIGVLTLFKKFKQGNWLRRFIGLAIGTLLGLAFFDLLPAAVEAWEEPHQLFAIILASIFGFFVIEKIVHHHHCRCQQDNKHLNKKPHLIVNNLIGDGLHNFIDGTIIAGAFLVDVKLGLTTTLAVALHEIPQELSDFSVLVYSGLSKIKAIGYNLLSALISVIGAVSVFLLADRVEQIVPVLLAVAAGNFTYLAMADLIPELQEEDNSGRVLGQLFWVGLGIAIIYALGIFFGHE